MKMDIRKIIRQEIYKKIFLNENEIYLDLTELYPDEKIYPEEILRISMGFGKGGYFQDGEFVEK